MKKLVLFILMLPFFSQGQEVLAGSGDTVLFNDTVYLNKRVSDQYNKATIQLILTKISASITGWAVLEGSLVDSAYSVISTDSLNILSVPEQTFFWTEDPLRFRYYRVRIHGTIEGNQARCEGFIKLSRQ